MCMVSNIGTGIKDEWEKRPWFPSPTQYFSNPITRAEFEALRNEVAELKKLLEAAQKFDAATQQPHCEIEDKVSLIRKIAELVGINLDDVLLPKPA